MTIFLDNRPLLEKFRKGDHDALSQVYYHYVGDVENLIRGRGARHRFVIRDVDRQQDIIQEVFIRAFSASARLQYDGLRPFKPYLLSIARNVLIDYLRKLPKETLGLALNDADDEQIIQAVRSDGLWSGDEEMSSRESGVDWERCLSASKAYVASLVPSEQRFVELRYKQELPQLMVAKALDITRWKVRSLEKKIQNGLKRFLAREKLVGKDEKNSAKIKL